MVQINQGGPRHCGGGWWWWSGFVSLAVPLQVSELFQVAAEQRVDVGPRGRSDRSSRSDRSGSALHDIGGGGSPRIPSSLIIQTLIGSRSRSEIRSLPWACVRHSALLLLPWQWRQR